MKGARTDGERGSAVAEFTLVAGLLVLVALTVMQLALALHVRNVLTDAAAEGARHAALEGAAEDAGTQRTRDLITATLSVSYAENIRTSTIISEGVELRRVEVSAPLPLVGLVGPAGVLEVRGHAVVEGTT